MVKQKGGMMEKKRFKRIILIKDFLIFVIFLLFTATSYLKAEDSNLKEIVDSQGNVYQIDKEGKIYTGGIPHPNRQPATVENLEYYFNQSLLLESNGYIEEAIKMYYEILCLPKGNQSVVNARRAISLRIKRLYNDEGKRDLVIKYFNVKRLGEGNMIQYINKRFNFAFKYPSSWKISKEIIEDKQKNVAFISLVAPAVLDNEGNVVDISLGLLAESMVTKIQPLGYADIWYKKMPNYIRADIKTLSSGGIKDKFTVNFMGRDYCGEEAFWVKNEVGYYLTFNAGPSLLYELTKDYFYQILDTIELE